MGLRNKADVRTLLWVLLMPIGVAAAYARPDWALYLAPVNCYLALAAGIFAHNHNHCPTFKTKRQNFLFGLIISQFYGYPTFAWVPTHNLNHHKLVNRAGDATITWRYTNKHNWLVASTYFFVSSYWQSEPIKDYIAKAKANNPKLFRNIVTQYVTWGGINAALLIMSVALHGFRTGIVTFLLTTALPSFFALWTIMLFNYVQHVHTDPWSKHDHSRNFTGWVMSFFLFNNGFHGVHHENPGAHWSTLPTLFKKVEAEIHPDLKQNNVALFFLNTYVLALLWPKFGTKQLGRAPFDPPAGGKIDLTTAEVAASEASTNAAMV